MYQFKFDGLTCEFNNVYYRDLLSYFDPSSIEVDPDDGQITVSNGLYFCDHHCTGHLEDAKDSSCPLAVTFVGQDKGRIRKSEKEPCFYLLQRILSEKEYASVDEWYEDYIAFEWGVSEKEAKRILTKIQNWIKKNFVKV